MDFALSVGVLIITISIVLITWGVRVALLLYIPRNRKPTTAMAWLLAIFMIPVVGLVLFFIIGSTKLSKRRRDRQRTVNKIIESVARPDTAAIDALPRYVRERYKPLIDQNQALGKLPVRAGNSVTLLADYNGAITDITAHVAQAKHHVYLEYYILALDDVTKPLFTALEAAVKRGVKVYVMFDTFGSRKYKNYSLMQAELTRMGVHWTKILPVKLRFGQYNRPDLRNHRKILVIDDQFAYLGSQNLIDMHYERRDDISYDEMVVRVSGPVVNQCAAVFAGDWFSETGQKITQQLYKPQKNQPFSPNNPGSVLAQVLPSGSGYTYENNMLLFVSLMYAAKHEIMITNPYFVPNEALLTAVTAAARRGVSVSLINSEAMDQWMVGHAQRSFYAQLLAAGVKIHLYQAPKLLHSKYMTVDDDIAVIGSSNMDVRSFELNSECVIVCYDKSVVVDLRLQQQRDLKKSKQVRAEQWKQRGVWQELLDNVARLTAALQ